MSTSRPPNFVEHTWLAYALHRDQPEGALDDALGRVERHYQALRAEPLRRDVAGDGRIGLALWQRPMPALRWPLFAAEGETAAAWTNAPTGWSRLIGDAPPETASLQLATALRADPARLVDLNPPFTLGVHDAGAGELTLLTDFIGIGRLYELRTEAGWVWSNRLGALPLFAGVAPTADAHGWDVFAAAGWFLGRTTALTGAAKLPGGSIVKVRAEAGHLDVQHHRAPGRGKLIGPRSAPFDTAVSAASEEALELARDVGRLWATRVSVDLSAGRDSRISAAAAIEAGIDADFQTVDLDPGESEVATRLAESASRPIEHVMLAAEPESIGEDLGERLRVFQHMHDGMANPQVGLRGAMIRPGDELTPPVISGHGGEMGHGFYYRAQRHLFRLEGKGRFAMAKRLLGMGRKGGSAARGAAYAAYATEISKTLDDGESLGLEGPNLLDYFYLSQRLAHRSGLGFRSDRYSACATPAFVRACFDLEPAERLEVRLHRAMVAQLAPAWADIPFYGGPGSDGAVNYQRIWERQADMAHLEAMLGDERPQSELFRQERIRSLWDEARTGTGTVHHERILLRIAWRDSFEDHLQVLAAAAAQGRGLS